MLLIATFAILPHYFSTKIGLANGIMNLGSSVVAVGVPLVVASCLKNLGLKETWLVKQYKIFVFNSLQKLDELISLNLKVDKVGITTHIIIKLKTHLI